jgi:hypothetical protein
MFSLDVSQWVNDTKRKLEAMQNTSSIALADLFPPAFMAGHSELPDFDTFARESGLDFTPEGFAAMDAEALDVAVQRLTKFDSWQAMQQAGLAGWFDRQ